jgi:DNA-binding MarR family transcriptional regulator
MDPRQEVALDQVLELTVLLAEDMEGSLGRDGLTPARAHLLWVLRERGPSTQVVLADALRVSARNVTGLVDALEAAGLVARRPHPTDRRATLVGLTEQGGTITARMAHDKALLAAGLFGGLGAEQVQTFSDTLAGVLDRLKVMVADAADTSREPT